jgi:two-component system chemotaxis response regulator CheY
VDENFAKLKILLVEDHDAHAAALLAMLGGFGIRHVDRAADVEAAVRYLKAGTLYDLMLCDFNLGAINGLSLVKIVRANNQLTNRFMPIVMITGETKTERVIAARDAGVNSFLSKPIHPPTLLRTIEGIINVPRAFVQTKEYFGPDRRRRQDDTVKGRRSSDRSEDDDDGSAGGWS